MFLLLLVKLAVSHDDGLQFLSLVDAAVTFHDDGFHEFFFPHDVQILLDAVFVKFGLHVIISYGFIACVVNDVMADAFSLNALMDDA